jgi:hypothetical protein
MRKAPVLCALSERLPHIPRMRVGSAKIAVTHERLGNVLQEQSRCCGGARCLPCVAITKVNRPTKGSAQARSIPAHRSSRR